MMDVWNAADISQRTKESIAHRKAAGKSVGMSPFGTVRNKEGYLQPSPFGAWLLSDGRHVPGEVGKPAPQDGATWKGYYDCAGRILELYSHNKRGVERIAYDIAMEGWAFRNNKGLPRHITRDD